MRSKVKSQTAKVSRWSVVGILSGVLFCLLTVHGSLFTVSAQTSSFTYQGKLADSGVAANGTYDITFKLYDTLANGTQIGTDIVRDDVVVSDGGFTVDLDFGAAAFASGASRFLQLEVRPGASAGTFTTLVPRQPLTSSPYAVKAASSSAADWLSAECVLCVTDAHIFSISGGKISAGSITADKFADDSVTQNALRDGNVTTNKIADGAVTNGKLAPASVDSPQLADGSVTTSKLSDGSVKRAKLAADSVDATHLSALSVTSTALGDGSVLTNKIADGAVTKSKLAANFKNGFDPQLVAMQRWDMIPVQKNSATVGRQPSGLAFDGTFMYVSNKLDNNVMRIRVSTGLVEGSPITVGNAPTALAFDGTFIYVANSGSNNVSRIRADTFTIEGSPITVGTAPSLLAFDGTFVNVGNVGSGSITRIRTQTGTVDGDPIVTNQPPRAMVFAGTHIYIATFEPATTIGRLQRIPISTGGIENVVPSNYLASLTFDGTFVYLGSRGTFTRFRVSTGAEEFPMFGTLVTGGSALASFDGTGIYFGANSIHRANINSLGVESASIGFSGNLTAFGFDGTYTYAALDIVDPSGGGIPVTLNGVVIRF